MRLTLLLDGDIGTPLSEQQVADHPDKATLQEALDLINKDAQYTLVEAPAEAAKKAEAEAKKAEAEAKKSDG